MTGKFKLSDWLKFGTTKVTLLKKMILYLCAKIDCLLFLSRIQGNSDGQSNFNLIYYRSYQYSRMM